MDRVQFGIYAGTVCLVGFSLAAYMIMRENLGSRTLALGIGSVAAALLLFIIQLLFELQPTIMRDHISTLYTLDRGESSVRQPSYSLEPLSKANVPITRPMVDIEASRWLREHNPLAFQQNRDKLVTDLVVFNLLAFLGEAEFDWQLRRVRYATRGVGDVLYIVRPESSPNECTIIKSTDLRAKLAAAGNLFSDSTGLGFQIERSVSPASKHCSHYDQLCCASQPDLPDYLHRRAHNVEEFRRFGLGETHRSSEVARRRTAARNATDRSSGGSDLFRSAGTASRKRQISPVVVSAHR
jgi:hypothetical protein